ncbi:MAG: S-adenosylhomocysteine/5'-methylthioadenosine [Geobacteraceae bacterium]|nr:MAG: S-adenosylhomocysteine/5'-methylthioadenosine [Geobacteraceae bacterium]
MGEQTIGLIAAMPEEINPLLRKVGPVEKEKLAGFNLYSFSIGRRKVCLVESGMGLTRAASATHALIAKANPDIILNFGFAGAVTAGVEAGDLVVATRILLHRDRLFSEQPGIPAELAERMIETLGKSCREKTFRIYRGTCITASHITKKEEMVKLLPTGVANPVLDMETAAVARVAAKEKVPFLAVRAISDGADEELGFAIEEFTDREMNIRVWKVLMTVARKPWIVPQLLRLAKNCRVAGKNLAAALPVILENLP